MEIEQLRQEINDLLDNVVEHSNSYTGKEHLSSLDVSFILKKVNKAQEALAVLKFLLDVKHQERGGSKAKAIESILEEKMLDVESIVKTEVLGQNMVAQEIEETIAVKEAEFVDLESGSPKKDNLEEPSIAKLSDGLTLNDRYLYANELFDKDMNAFNDLVKSIDECASLDEAISLYSSSDWELDNEYVISFTDLVERRFS